MSTRPIFHAAVHGVFFRQGLTDLEVLMGRRENTSYGDGLYACPAGHIENGETAEEALAAEMQEEIGVSPERLQFARLGFQAAATEVGSPKSSSHFSFIIPSFPETAQILSLQHYKDCGKGEFQDYFETAFVLDGTGMPFRNAEPEKCGDLRYFPVSALPSNTLPLSAHIIDCVLNGVQRTTFGYEKRQIHKPEARAYA